MTSPIKSSKDKSRCKRSQKEDVAKQDMCCTATNITQMILAFIF
jgi:hypothetical protein